MKKQKYVRFLIAMLAIFMASSVFAAAPDTLEQSVTRSGETITMQLTRQDLRGPQFELWVQNATGEYDVVTPVEERSYLGTVDEYPGAVACGILKDDAEFMGAVIFSRGGQWWVVGDSTAGSKGMNEPKTFRTATGVSEGQGGTTMYGFDVGIDADSEYFRARGSSDVATTFELIEYNVAVTRALYMQNALLRPYLGRVIIRTDSDSDPYKGDAGSRYLNSLKSNWTNDQTPRADRDVTCGVSKTRALGGLATVGNIGAAYSINNSTSSGKFFIIWRHEMGHNWSLGHYDGGSPEGATINSGNVYHRMSGAEARKVLNHRTEKLHRLDDEGTFTAVNLPPYASIDDDVLQLGVDPNITIDVILNDHDGNGDLLELDSFDAVSKAGGTITLSEGTGPDGRDEVIYAPPERYDGDDWFYYNAIDPSGHIGIGVHVVDVRMSYTVYEAEDAVFSNAHTSTSSSGYTGTGYLIFDQDNAYVEWTVNLPADATYYLDFRHYSTVAGTAEIKVNDQMLDSNYSISSVSGWKYTSQRFVQLNEGDNTIRLTVPTYAMTTVDHLRLTDIWQSEPPPPSTEIADAYVKGGDNADINYGSEVDLWLKKTSPNNSRQFHLLFPYTELLDTEIIDTATLRLIPTLLGPEISALNMRVRLLDDADDSWLEDTITWNNAPSGTGNEVIIDGEEFIVDQAYDIDVTSLLDQAQNSNKVASFHVDVTSSEDGSRYVVFGSKEGPAMPEFLITTLSQPAAPTSLMATPGDSSVSLDWNDNTEPDLAYYDIYRSTTSGSGYASIYSGQTTSDYVDNTVTNETPYYYVVTAIDANSNESDYSNEASATPVEPPVIFNPTEDAFVKGGSDDDTNYGSSDDLWLKNDDSSTFDRDSYLLFAYSAVTDPIETATLRLFPTKVGSSVSNLDIRVRLLDDSDDSWSEDTITWNNRDSGIEPNIVIDGEECSILGQPLDIDVTSLLEQAHNSNKIASFHIDVTSSATTNRYVVFASKEDSSEPWWPQLVLTLRREGDLTGDGFVNLQDFALFAMNWQDTDCGYCNGADLYVDGQVNFLDLLIIVENWLVP